MYTILDIFENICIICDNQMKEGEKIMENGRSYFFRDLIVKILLVLLFVFIIYAILLLLFLFS